MNKPQPNKLHLKKQPLLNKVDPSRNPKKPLSKVVVQRKVVQSRPQNLPPRFQRLPLKIRKRPSRLQKNHQLVSRRLSLRRPPLYLKNPLPHPKRPLLKLQRPRLSRLRLRPLLKNHPWKSKCLYSSQFLWTLWLSQSDQLCSNTCNAN